MSFLEPQRLWLLLIVLGLVALYVVLQMRKSGYAVRFTNLDLLDAVVPPRLNWRQHVAVGLALATLAFAIVLFAQPSKVARVPIEVTAEATVVLTVDVSLSMQAADVEPDRFTLAKTTAVGFLDELPSNFNAALVSFSGVAALEAPPTQDRSKVAAAVEELVLAERTATGEGIFAALDVIEQEQAEYAANHDADRPPAFIVMISDGHRTAGRSQVEAAEAAAAARVPIFTVALGTSGGFIMARGEHVQVPVEIDELQEIADISGGQAYIASTPADLLDAYDSVETQLEFREQRVDATSDYVPYLLLLCLVSTIAGLFVASRWP